MKPLHEAVFLLGLAALPALLSGFLHPKRPEWSWTKPEVEQVDLAEISRWKAPVLWVDARESAAYNQKHIPESVLLNETHWNDLVPDFLTAWHPDTRVIVYCDSQKCGASREVALRLKREMNLKEIYVMRGGWAAWEQAHP